jgi:ArsR family transcriptional regulator
LARRIDELEDLIAFFCGLRGLCVKNFCSCSCSPLRPIAVDPRQDLDVSRFVDRLENVRVANDTARAAELFHALSDETRVGILEMLQDGERCVCDLQGDLDAAQSRLSFHLKVLRDAGLVSDRKEGRWSYYTIIPGALAELHDVVVSLQPSTGKSLPLSRSSGRCCN